MSIQVGSTTAYALLKGDVFSLDGGDTFHTCARPVEFNIIRTEDNLWMPVPASGLCMIAVGAKQCVTCGTPTTELVRGKYGPLTGMMCADCQFDCDGNIITEES